MPVNQEFKKIIDRIKYEHSINQAQIAEKLGVKSTYLSDMINGRVPYNDSMSKKIYEVFHIAQRAEGDIIEIGINDRIQKVIADNFHGDIPDFCNKLNIRQATITNTLERNIQPSQDILNAILGDSSLNVNSVWLSTGEGEPYKINDTITETKQGFTTYLLPMSAMGGSLTGFAQQGVTLQNCEAIISPIENVDFAITVYGESMAPEYPSGSRILIKKINPDIFIDWGKVFVLDTPNGVVIKEVHESNIEGCVSCHSINTDQKFKPFDVPMNEVFGMYRVLMCLSAK